MGTNEPTPVPGGTVELLTEGGGMLAPVSTDTAYTVFTTDAGTEPYLARIRAQLDGFKGDVSTKKGRELIASMAYKVSQSKTYLDGVGKELADAQKAIPKKIDAARKLVRDTLDQWRDEVRAPLTAWEEAEQVYQSRTEATMLTLTRVSGDNSVRSQDTLNAEIEAIRAVTATADEYRDMVPAIEAAKGMALATLERLLSDAIQRDKDAAELAALRVQAAATAAAAEAERVKSEAAEAKRVKEKAAADKRVADAEAAATKAIADAQAAAAKAVQDAADAVTAERQRVADKAAADKLAADNAILEAQLATQRAENARIEAAAEAQRVEAKRLQDIANAAETKRLQDEADAQKARDAQAARERDEKHKAGINNAAMQAFVKGGMDQAAARLAVVLIAKTLIPSVSITY